MTRACARRWARGRAVAGQMQPPLPPRRVGRAVAAMRDGAAGVCVAGGGAGRGVGLPPPRSARGVHKWEAALPDTATTRPPPTAARIVPFPPARSPSTHAVTLARRAPPTRSHTASPPLAIMFTARRFVAAAAVVAALVASAAATYSHGVVVTHKKPCFTTTPCNIIKVVSSGCQIQVSNPVPCSTAAPLLLVGGTCFATATLTGTCTTVVVQARTCKKPCVKTCTILKDCSKTIKKSFDCSIIKYIIVPCSSLHGHYSSGYSAVCKKKVVIQKTCHKLVTVKKTCTHVVPCPHYK